ncbi:succinyl-CoA synthetase subunit alpha [archaeon AH-315-M20]|nr:succinyl-CoA synthetase subunit alpha [archaeon AH-315-M20]
MTVTNYDWFIENNLDKYAGKWVAIDNNKVLVSDLKLDILLKRIKEKYPKSRPIIGKITDKLLRLHS